MPEAVAAEAHCLSVELREDVIAAHRGPTPERGGRHPEIVAPVAATAPLR